MSDNKDIIKSIEEVFFLFKKIKPERIERLPQSGGDRQYYRVYTNDETLIATHNDNIKENETFFYFTKHFAEKNIPVAQIFSISDDRKIYLQKDFGQSSLLDKIETKGRTDEVFLLYKKSLEALAHMQIAGSENIDYKYSLTAKEFGRQAIFNDLLYFKYYFLDTLKLPYDKQILLDEFESLSNYLSQTDYKYFMFRDFQSRNILVDANDEIHFIDYQGGMNGALQYDVASLLWQAKAELSKQWKDALLLHYIDEADKYLPVAINKESFINQYNGYVLIRLLQVLGAYGFRGLFERKAHFLSSIPLALKNLRSFINDHTLSIDAPEFQRVLDIISDEKMIQKFQSPQANEHTKLVVHVNSFSFKKNIPEDENNNGGGFVFDCRGILNPGRFDAFKTLSGKDKAVIDFLEQRTKMSEYLNSVFNLIDISVEDYLSRGFENLMINFGCTGGQHRSVYAAEQTARHLKNKYKVKVVLNHTNENNWVKKTDKV